MAYQQRLGIVILNYKTWEKTVSCVQSIYETYRKPKEIVIVDNKSPNDSFNRLSTQFPKSDFPEISIIETDKNGGFSYGNNYGFDYIAKHYPDISKIIITNNDIIFKEKSIEALINAFSCSDNVVMSAPSVYNIEGERTNAPWRKKPTVLQELGIKSTKGCSYEWSELPNKHPVYMVCGCCLMVDKNLFFSVGRFDDNVFLYNEENIFSKKFADSNLQIIYCPDAKIIHDHGSTTGNRNTFVDKEFVKSTLYFMKEYEGLSIIQIELIRLFYVFRMIIKQILGRYDNCSLLKSLKEIILYKV